MSPPLLLRSDGQSLRTGTCTIVPRRSSKFGASAAQRRDSVAFFFISPCDSRLLPFPEVKKQLKGTLFASAEDACRAFAGAVEDIPKSTWAEEWNRWFHRMAKFIAAEGRFLEFKKKVSPISNEYPETVGASLA